MRKIYCLEKRWDIWRFFNMLKSEDFRARDLTWEKIRNINFSMSELFHSTLSFLVPLTKMQFLILFFFCSNSVRILHSHYAFLAEKHLVSFWLLVIVNRPKILLSKYLWSRIQNSFVICQEAPQLGRLFVFSFVRLPYFKSLCSWPVCNTTKKWVFPFPLFQCLLSVVSLIFIILTGVRWNLHIILIWICRGDKSTPDHLFSYDELTGSYLIELLVKVVHWIHKQPKLFPRL